MTRVVDFRASDATPAIGGALVSYVAWGDELSTPRRIAAAVVAADGAAPRTVVDVGSFQGELLEAFLDEFPEARGQWTDAGDNSLPIAQERLGRFGDRVTYRIGCPRRDVSDGTVPQDVDVLMTSWLSSHRPAADVPGFYEDAAALLAPGGWLVHIEHAASADDVWTRRLLGARAGFHVPWEGPPAHHDQPIATLDEHLAGFRDAGLTDVAVVWQSLGTYLLMGRRAL